MNITPLKLEHHPVESINCYVVEVEDSYVLIDTGEQGDWDQFRRRLRETGIELSQISYLFLTHHHHYHCGLLHNILLENDTIRVIMSQLCKGLLLTGKDDATHSAFYVNRRVALIYWLYRSILGKTKTYSRRHTSAFLPYQVRECDVLVTDVELRDIGIPLSCKIFATPGHSIDSASLLFRDGDCLVGDAASNVGESLVGDAAENVFQYAGARYCAPIIGDLKACYESWEKIIASGARRIFPAHGVPFTVDKLQKNLWKNKAEHAVPLF